MLLHVVLMQPREAATEAELAALKTAFQGLKAEIPEVKRVWFGPNESGRHHGHTHVLVTEFADADGLARYAVHPAHRQVVTLHIEPLMERLTVADVTLP